MYLAPLLLIAAAFWGQTPDCGQPTIATASLPVAARLEVVGTFDPDSCVIVVDPSHFRFSGAACMAVVHEYGHLLGLGHSLDPNNVMYPLMRRPLWPCVW
jgi:hypothetical protein